MYNRYIPQPDGTYRRSRVGEPSPIRQPPNQEKKEVTKQRPVNPNNQHHTTTQQKKNVPEKNILGFLSQLLPRDFDTSDLLVILLLLLMSGENGEDQSTALLTLILYLFQ